MPWDFIEWAIVMVKISRQPEKERWRLWRKSTVCSIISHENLNQSIHTFSALPRHHHNRPPWALNSSAILSTNMPPTFCYTDALILPDVQGESRIDMHNQALLV
jgi:hypothetical protein